MVGDSFAEAQALFISRIKEESSSLAFPRLFILAHAASMEGESNISSNLAWAASNVSTVSIVLSKAPTADKHLAPSLAMAG